jgi:hypothetical protein
MSTQVARDHHTVPRLYLRGFISTKGPNREKLVARHRDGGEELIEIKKATVVTDFYDLGDGKDADDAFEKWLNQKVENPVGELMVEMRRGVLSGEPEARKVLASFVAVQMARTVAFRALLQDLTAHLGPVLFANLAIGRALGKEPLLAQDRPTLDQLHIDLAHRAPDSARAAGKRALLRGMIREVDRLKVRLLKMEWFLSTSSEKLLITSDTPVVVVRSDGVPAPAPATLPLGHEVHLPITPSRLLTISPFPSLGVPRLTPEQAQRVNDAIVYASYRTVFRHPDMAWPQGFVLPRERATLQAPRVKTGISENEPPTNLTMPELADPELSDVLSMLAEDPADDPVGENIEGTATIDPLK